MMGAPEKKKRLALFMRNCVVSDQILILPRKDQNDTDRPAAPLYQSMKTRLGPEGPEHQLDGGLGLRVIN